MKRQYSNSFHLKILAGLQFTNILDFVIMMPLGPHFINDFNIDAQQFGFLVASYTVSASVAGLFASLWVDRFSRRHTLLFIYAGFTIATFLCALSNSYYVLMFTRLLAGAFAGVLGATILTIVSDLFPYHERGKAVSAITRAFSVASVIGVPLGLMLADSYSWKLTFLFISVIATILWLAAYRTIPLLDEHMKNTTTSNNSIKENIINLVYIIKKPQHIKAFLLMGMMMFGGFVLIPYISPYLVGNAEVSQTDLKLVYLVGGIFTYFSQKTVGIFSDRFGSKKIFVIMASSTFLPILILTNLPPSPLWQVLTVTTVFMVSMSGRFVPAMTLIASSALPKDRGSFMNLSTAVQQMSSGLASSLGGMILVTNADNSITYYNVAGYLGIFLTGISILLALRIVPYVDDPEPINVLKSFDEELM